MNTDKLMQYLPYIIIVIETAALAVLIVFVRKWGKEYKAWKAEQEDSEIKQKEKELDQALANDRRKR